MSTNELKEGGMQGIQAVNRAFRILEILASSERGLSLSDVARALDVNKQIAWRLLQTLTELGYIYKYPRSERFTLSYLVSNLGHRKLLQEEIMDQARATLLELAEASGELSRLGVEEGNKLMWVMAETGKQWLLNITPNYAPTVRLHATAAGKAWLSTKPRDFVDEILHANPLTRRTEYTIVDRDAFYDELEVIRERGWALSWQESEIGVGAVAAPIMMDNFDGSIRCVGVIAISAPTNRMVDREGLARWAPAVVSSCQRLGRMWPNMI